MDVSYIEKKSVDDLRTSAIAGDRIFFVRGQELISKCIYSYDVETLHCTFEQRVDHLCYFSGMVLVLCGSVLYKYRVFGEEVVLSGTHQLLGAPIRVCVSGVPERKESHAVCFLYKDKRIEVLCDGVEGVTVCCRGDIAREDEIVDFTVDGESSWFLSSSGRIYHTHSFVVSRTALLSRPVRMLPEPVYFEGAISRILAKNGRMYVCYSEGFEVYDIKKGALMLSYTYRTSDFELHASTSVYCLENKLVVADDAPRIIADVRVHRMFGDVGISRDKVLFVKKRAQGKGAGVGLLKEQDPDTRVREMFRVIENEIKVPDVEVSPEGNASERSLLMIQKMVNEFESRILDVYRRIYFELVTLNETFDQKIEGLNTENNLILKTVEILDERKNRVVERLRSLGEKMEKVVSGIRIDGGRVKELSAKVDKAIGEMVFGRYEKYSKILKMQREILSRKVV